MPSLTCGPGRIRKLHKSVPADPLLSNHSTLLQLHSIPPGIVLSQAEITDPAAEQPAAQPANSHQLDSQLGQQQGGPGPLAAGIIQTAVPLVIGDLGSGSSRPGLDGMAEAQPVRGSAGDDWLGLESGTGRKQRIRAQISSVAAPVRVSWPGAASALRPPAAQVNSNPEHSSAIHCKCTCLRLTDRRGLVRTRRTSDKLTTAYGTALSLNAKS